MKQNGKVILFRNLETSPPEMKQNCQVILFRNLEISLPVNIVSFKILE